MAQRVYGLALGYEDLLDHDELRLDPVLGVLLGKLDRAMAEPFPLAGKSTLNRLEHAPAEGKKTRYDKIGHEGAVKAVRRTASRRRRATSSPIAHRPQRCAPTNCATTDHGIGVRLEQGSRGELSRAAPDGAEQRPLRIVGKPTAVEIACK